MDKVNGKGLSSNDYTSEEKTKLANIAENAQVNVLEGIQVNGASVTPTNKIANINVPTNNNQLTNGAGYITGIDSADVTTALGFTPYNSTNPNGYIDASAISGKENSSNKITSITASATDAQYASAKATKDYVDDAVSSITGISFQIVQALPATGTNGVIYLISNSGSAPNIYDEYIWITSTSSFEKIGTTDVDLSGYVQASELVELTNAEIDAMFA